MEITTIRFSMNMNDKLTSKLDMTSKSVNLQYKNLTYIFFIVFILLSVTLEKLCSRLIKNYQKYNHSGQVTLTSYHQTLRIQKEDDTTIICPKLSSLSKVPVPCKSKKPKHPNIYNSSFIALYPVAFHSPGPSEQTHAFREIVAAAIESKKSVTLSPFTTHFTDNESIQSEVPVGARINLGKLCELVTIKEQTQNLDNVIMIGRLGGMMDFRWKEYAKSFTKFGDSTNFPTDTQNNWVNNMAHLHYPKNGFPFIYTDFRETLKKLEISYDNSTCCKLIGIASAHNLIYGNTLGLIDSGGTYLKREPVLADSRPPNPNEFVVRNEWRVNSALVKDVQLATEHPMFIKNLAEKFRNERLGDDFVGVHWRFNFGDIFSSDFLKSNGSNDGFIEKNAHVIGLSDYLIKLIRKCMNDPRFLLDKLIDHIEAQIPENELSTKTKTVFITSPVEVADIIASVGRNYRGYNFYTTKDTRHFLSRYRKKCETIDKIFGDILSTMEKEILIYSFCFYRMRPSNWSFNVQAHRWARKEQIQGFKYDSVIYDIFLSEDCNKRCLISKQVVEFQKPANLSKTKQRKSRRKPKRN